MRIAVLLSGGVDSSVALALLKKQGHDLTAFYLKIWLEDELSYLGSCPWQEDLSYVEAVCAQLQVPLRVVSLQREYHEQIVSYVVAEARAGRTPNPDVLCNKRIKFGLFWQAVEGEFDAVATGHYAQRIDVAGVAQLHIAPDAIKDQTYFLSHLSNAQLSRALFPIGHLSKEQVRQYAHDFDLPTKNRKDSQGICFLGMLKFRDFLAHYLGTQKGSLIEIETGKVWGEHDGFWFYTIGQRQGLGLAGGPWYVAAKDASHNIVYISRAYYAEDKQRDSFVMNQLNLIGLPAIDDGSYQVKLRHGPHRYEATFTAYSDGSMQVTLAQRDQGIAPGQFAVIYEGNRCLGGGVIRE